MSIRENVEAVLERMEKASQRAGRKKDETLLVAATKYAGEKEINELLQCNIRYLGENRVQALREKYPLIDSKKAIWHFIGSLQTNKVKYVLNKISLLHSLDRESLLPALQAQCEKEQTTIPVLVQVNISKESSKGGIFEENLLRFMEEAKQYPRIAVTGLMTMAPLSDEKTVRPVFKKLRHWFDQLNREGYGLSELSMGMTHDFETAIEEGATMIRIGSAIFQC